MTATVGFIGTGNMGRCSGPAVCKTVPPQQVLLAQPHPRQGGSPGRRAGLRRRYQ